MGRLPTLVIGVICVVLVPTLSGCGGSASSGQLDSQQPVSCQPGAQRCDGQQRLVCAADGTAWVAEDCVCGCQQTGDQAACRVNACQPGDQRCASTDQLLAVCLPDGCGWSETVCPNGCSQDRNACNSCTPNTRRCRDDGNAETCSALGNSWIVETCAQPCDPQTVECGACQPGSQRCEPTQLMTVQICGEGGWATLSNCPLGCSVDTKTCNQCQPGSKACRFGNLVRCNATGDLWTLLESCTVSCNDTTLSCNACKPGEQRCSGGVTREQCDGTGWKVIESCDFGCDTKGTACRVCQPGVRGCDQGNAARCASDGLSWETLESCTHGCDDQSKQCIGCTPGATRCLGQTQERCGDDGLTWTSDKTCPAGCHADKLVCRVCEPGQRVCDGATARLCNSDGSGWQETSCSNGCNVANGQCNLCRPFDSICEGTDTLRWCDYDGTRWLDTVCGRGCTTDGRCRTCDADSLSCTLANEVWQCDSAGVEMMRVDGCHHNCTSTTDPSISCTDRRYLSASVGSPLVPSLAHYCAVATDNTLWCWGWFNDAGFQRVVKPAQFGNEADRWLEVADGAHHSCAIKTDQSLWCWGASSSGELGNGGYQDKDQPTAVSGNASWARVVVGVMHSCAIRSDGTLWCWGRNLEGQLGTGVTGLDFPSPEQVLTTANTPWLRVSATQQTCAIQRADGQTELGRLYCWGQNLSGEVGLDPTASTTVMTPHEVAPGTLWRDVETGHDQLTCGIRDDGSLWCWGKNVNGLLGENLTATHLPTKIDAGSWASLSVGTIPCALSSAATSPPGGALRCWALKDAVSDRIVASLPVAPTSGWKGLTRGLLNPCALDVDDRLWCWSGIDSYLRDAPTAVESTAMWREVSVSGNVSCGISFANQLYCWGGGTRWQPQLVSNGTWKRVSVAGVGGCAIDGSGALQCWSDQSVQPTLVTSSSPAPWFAISVGAKARCGIRTDGSLWCWGLNDKGQVGDGTTTPRTDPQPIAPGTAWQTIAVHEAHSCGIQTDGSLWCWGSGANGRLGLGSDADKLTPQRVGEQTWKAIVAGLPSCAIRSDDTLWCWGGPFTNRSGDRLAPMQVGVDRWSALGGGIAIRADQTLWRILPSDPQPLLRVSEPAAASWLIPSQGLTGHRCAIRSDFSLYCWGQNNAGQLGIAWPTSITTRYLATD